MTSTAIRTLTQADLIESYRAASEQLPREAMEFGLRLTVRTVQALAKGRPVPPSELADIWEMPLEQVQAVLEQSVASGQAEVDAGGDLVGGVLTLQPTEHQITFDDTTVYAWCALDAIYAAGVVGKTAKIRSTDPITRGTIDLTVSPAGLVEVQPSGTVVTVVGADMGTDGGRSSQRCRSMLLFESRTSAAAWMGDRPGVAILTVAEAREIADAFVVDPARRAGLV